MLSLLGVPFSPAAARILGVVQIRTTLKTRSPVNIRALWISGVFWKWYFLNHAADRNAVLKLGLDLADLL